MKAAIRAFYRRKPAYSYFSGVSDSRHEALVLAQRYPADFDGIIAGAPNNWAPLAGLAAPGSPPSTGTLRAGRSNRGELLALHAAVMAACADANGVIKDLRACTFDPASSAAPPAPIRRAVWPTMRSAWSATNIVGPWTSTPAACSTVGSLRLRTGLGQLAGHAGRGRRRARRH